MGELRLREDCIVITKEEEEEVSCRDEVCSTFWIPSVQALRTGNHNGMLAAACHHEHINVLSVAVYHSIR